MKSFGIWPIVAATLTLSLAACAGGSSDSAPVTVPALVVGSVPPVGTAGVFDVDHGQFTGIYTILDNGKFYGLHFFGHSPLPWHPHRVLTAASSLSSIVPISWANFIDNSNKVGAQDGAGQFGRSFSPTQLSKQISGSLGVLSATSNIQKAYASGSNKTLYNDPIPTSALNGAYSGTMRTAGIGMPQQSVNDFAIDSAGVLTANAVGCNFKGTMRQHGSTGIFDLQVQTSGAACHLDASLTGIVTPLSFSNNVAQLGVQLNNSNHAQTAVFIVTKT